MIRNNTLSSGRWSYSRPSGGLDNPAHVYQVEGVPDVFHASVAHRDSWGRRNLLPPQQFHVRRTPVERQSLSRRMNRAWGWEVDTRADVFGQMDELQPYWRDYSMPPWTQRQEVTWYPECWAEGDKVPPWHRFHTHSGQVMRGQLIPQTGLAACNPLTGRCEGRRGPHHDAERFPAACHRGWHREMDPRDPEGGCW